MPIQAPISAEAGSQKDPKPTILYRLKSGSHVDAKAGIVIEPGDVFASEIDLVRQDGPNRWERVDDAQEVSIEELKARIKILEGRPSEEQPKQEEPADLDKLTIKQLREKASAMEPPVDLTDCSGKDEIVNALQQAMDAA
jgi:hypothetical protein